MTGTIKLTERQAEAAYSTENKILCIAGPGSGKTRTLIERIKWLVREKKIDPKTIACVTFTNAGAGEIADRIDGIRLGFNGTLHKFCLRLLKEHGHLNGYRGGFIGLFPEGQKEEFLETIIKELNLKTTPKDCIENQKSKNQGDLFGVPEYVKAWREYYRRLKRANLVDFSVILNEGQALAKNPDCKKAVRGKIKYLFVDECQDSSPIDFSIYGHLSIENEFFVGDPDQGIYGFRGASLDGIMDMAEGGDYKTVWLEDNFRSLPVICNRAQKLIEHNRNRVKKKLVPIRRTDPECDIKGFVNVDEYLTCQEELVEISHKAKSYIDCGVQPQEIAVIAFYNHTVKAFRDYFAIAGLPLATIKGRKTDSEISKVLAIVDVMINPRNDFVYELYLRTTKSKKEAQKMSLDARTKGVALCDYYGVKFEDCGLRDLTRIMSEHSIRLQTIETIDELLSQTQPGTTLLDFASDLKDTFMAVESNKDGIQCTTMHGSKGKEFQVVFLVGFENEIIPSYRGEKEEKRRLAYVAMTRAKDVLEISHVCKREAKWGETKEHCPSQFLTEAGL